MRCRDGLFGISGVPTHAKFIGCLCGSDGRFWASMPALTVLGNDLSGSASLRLALAGVEWRGCSSSAMKADMSFVRVNAATPVIEPPELLAGIDCLVVGDRLLLAEMDDLARVVAVVHRVHILRDCLKCRLSWPVHAMAG